MHKPEDWIRQKKMLQIQVYVQWLPNIQSVRKGFIFDSETITELLTCLIFIARQTLIWNIKIVEFVFYLNRVTFKPAL